MSNWSYVAIAYTVVWGALAIYALALARRVTQARAVERSMRSALKEDNPRAEQDSTVCDAPPAP